METWNLPSLENALAIPRPHEIEDVAGHGRRNIKIPPIEPYNGFDEETKGCVRDTRKTILKHCALSKDLASSGCKFGFSMPNCIYYQLERSGNQEYDENI